MMALFDFQLANVLIVDDQVSNIQLIYQVLKDDYNVYMARSGTEAIDLIKSKRPDIILLDVYMPELTGLELCQILKADPYYSDIPIIFITSFTDPAQEVACWEAGGVDFVQKPINQLTLSRRVKAHLTLKFQADVLKHIANLDGLTGIYNRRYLDEQGAALFCHSQKQGEAFSVVMFDIDYFKGFNDQYGHLMGDDCLKAVAHCIKGLVSDEKEILVRYGGEEFILLISGKSKQQVGRLVDTICQAVSALKIPHESSGCSDFVSLSAGGLVCEHPERVELKSLIERSDVLLYQAKSEGRNRAVIESV
ncbi:Response regulator PleD [Marinomonas aquimarina]|uniref:diguanylate cyclase n=2 Tax=Marinomonas aquimarina TaxID=295068 RepID=A0A1A8T598_9GAMM|nr:Response regulator PleD [Marinomonas aquimarina]